MTIDIESPTPAVKDLVARGSWGSKLEFLFSCLSYAVGLGNLWRFPYLCYRNGGGAFLIPYVIMLVFAGLPMMCMELAFGQFAGEGVLSIWSVCPLMQGIGWGMIIVSTFIMIYYNVIISWTIYYLFASFNKKLPWENCDKAWNTPNCGKLDQVLVHNCTDYSGIWYNRTCYSTTELNSQEILVIRNLSKAESESRRYPSEEFFHNYVLGISQGFHEMGEIKWQLAMCLMLAWLIVFLCLIKGIKSQGKVVYFTAIFPYLVLTVLLVRGLTLPGAANGIYYFLTPQWHRLANAQVWGDAAVQIFFSLSPCWGGLITLASFNQFNNNCMSDAILVSIGNSLTSFFAGFVIFSILGFMAHEMNVGVGDVAAGGAGLAFIIYPEAVSRLPISPMWSVMFFAMLITLGLGTQFSTVCTVHTTIMDVYPSFLRRGQRPLVLILVICVFGFILGLACTTRGGMYLVQLIDNYAATYSLLIIGLAECLTLAYIYGVNNFCNDISSMLGKQPHWWWKIMWCLITPGLLTFIMIFTWVDYTPSNYGSYHFPVWADVLGWMITMVSVLAIPVVAVRNIIKAPSQGSLLKTIKWLVKPSERWLSSKERQKRLAFVKSRTTIPLFSDLVLAGTPLQDAPTIEEISEGPNQDGDPGTNSFKCDSL